MRYFMELAGRTALVDTSLELRPTAESIPFLRPVTKADGAAAGGTGQGGPPEPAGAQARGGPRGVEPGKDVKPEEKPG